MPSSCAKRTGSTTRWPCFSIVFFCSLSVLIEGKTSIAGLRPYASVWRLLVARDRVRKSPVAAFGHHLGAFEARHVVRAEGPCPCQVFAEGVDVLVGLYPVQKVDIFALWKFSEAQFFDALRASIAKLLHGLARGHREPSGKRGRQRLGGSRTHVKLRQMHIAVAKPLADLPSRRSKARQFRKRLGIYTGVGSGTRSWLKPNTAVLEQLSDWCLQTTV
jgi:hypothetical protein